MNKRGRVLGVICVSLLLFGCSTIKDTTAQERRRLIAGKFELIKEHSDISGQSFEVVDPDTGIHYYMGQGSYSFMSPVIEKDGSIRGAKHDS